MTGVHGVSGTGRLSVTAAVAVLLTGLSLQPLLQNATWLPTTVIFVAIVAATGYLARRFGLPRLVVPVIQLAVLAFAVVQRFAAAQTIWGLVPGRDVRLALQGFLDTAFTTISTTAPPVPVTPGLVLLIAASVAAVAILVDTVAVTYRSPALAGIPMLVLYAVPVAVVANGVSWVYFGLAATGWLALMLADSRDRVGGWGRRLGTRTFAGDPLAQDGHAPPEPLGAVGRRIGVTAVAIAVILPAILPGLSEAVFGRGVGGQGDHGATVTTVNPFVSLGSDLNRPDDTEVLHYTTTAARPDYLRLVTLDTFDGKNWIPASLETSGRLDTDPLPPPAGLGNDVPVASVRSEFTSTELTGSTWLPVPYPAADVSVIGPTKDDWLWDQDNRVIWSPESDTFDTSWTVNSLTVSPTPGELRSPGPVDPGFLERYTALPPRLPDIVATEAAKATKGAQGEFAEAVALQDYFLSDDFLYDVSTPTTSANPLSVFLTSKRGFCQQFAGTFAVMARDLGLPTRVVVGFVPGAKQSDGSWSVTWHDTHAWPEVYFQGVGWTRFEPTPRSDNGGVDVPAYTIPAIDTDGNGPGTNRPDDNRQTPNTNTGVNVPPKATDSLTGSTATGAGAVSTTLPWRWLALGLLVLLILFFPWGIRGAQRRQRLRLARTGEPRAAAAAAWAELAASAIDLDMRWARSRTPRQVAAGLVAAADLEGSSEGAALGRTARTVEYARYARTPAPTDGLAADLSLGVSGLRESASRFTRLRATFVPRSLTSRAGSRTADVLDWFDTAPRRVGTALRPRRQRAATVRDSRETVSRR